MTLLPMVNTMLAHAADQEKQGACPRLPHLPVALAASNTRTRATPQG